MSTISNPQIELAFDYVCQTNKHIFLTGKAGTGKTTFLRRVRREVNKRMAVVAPTGVAAINAEGVTIHSLFQLPFGTLLPGQIQEQIRKRRFARKKIDLIRSLDLLIIDEISMVRADVLDAIDEVLRRYRDYSRPFGGLQLLMIGDLHQLPPVVKPEDWDQLRAHYSTPYFFGSLALKKTDAVTIELRHIYRQSDSQFIDLLNQVRGNQMDAAVLELLNSRYRPDFKTAATEGYITLSSHNATARRINAERLNNISGPVHLFKATITGDFPAHTYPTEPELEFKVNAQVMFVKNDLAPEKRFYNGKIGRIIKIEEELITVRCPEEGEDIGVEIAEWSNIKYTLDADTKEVREEVIGTFRQFPLKLAWAITIHKSQGLTFERVIIDAQAAFAHGQVYVALSRCKTFEGIVLRTQIVPSSVKTDSVVQNFSEKAQQQTPTTEQLLQAKREYQQSLLRELFSFKKLNRHFSQLKRFLLENESSIQGNMLADLNALETKTQEKVFSVADKFAPQLGFYLAQPALPEENASFLERLRKASSYFAGQIKDGLLNEARELNILTDNNAVRKKAREKLEDLQKEFFVKNACFESCLEGFDSQGYVQSRTNAELDFRQVQTSPAPRSKTPRDIEHPELYQQLTRWRADTADFEDVPRYAILPTRSILEMVQVLPTSTAALKRISGIGKRRAERFGAELLQIISKYCQDHDLATDQLQFASGKAPKMPKPPRPNTKAISFELFRSGKSVEEIAAERTLVPSTIEGHLAHYIKTGEMDIFELIPKTKVDTIAASLKETESLSEVKNKMGDACSYGELRMVWNYLQRSQEE